MSPLAELTVITVTRATVGMVTGFLLALLVQEVRTRLLIVDRAYRPLLFLCYGIPAFGLSLFAGAAGLPDRYDWLLVGLTLVIPMEMAIATAAAEADTFDQATLGTWPRRLWHVRLPAMSPMLLLGVALTIPLALLSAMLIEVAEAGIGLGPTLQTLSLSGVRAQLPLVLVITMLSGGGFALFSITSRQVRRRLGLASYRAAATIQMPHNLHLGGRSFAWSLVLVLALWWLMHWTYPVMVGAPFDPSPLRRLMPALTTQIAQTVLSITVGGVAGTVAGAFAAVTVLARPGLKPTFDALLLPLQIVPLQVFTPFLLVLALAAGPIVTFTSPPVLGLDWPAILVGILASAYLALQFLGTWLHLLPGRTSSIIAAQPISSPRLVRHVLAPWLARGTGTVLPALLPRLVAAVLVTEYLITQRGLGGAIATARAERDFKGSFVILMIIVLVVILTQGIASLLARTGEPIKGGKRA